MDQNPPNNYGIEVIQEMWGFMNANFFAVLQLLVYFFLPLNIIRGLTGNVLDPFESKEYLPMILFSFTDLVLGALATIAIIDFVYRKRKNKRHTIDFSIQTAFQLLLPVLATMITVIVTVFFGFLLFIIPGFLALYFLLFAVEVAVIQRIFFIDALKESYRLILANWQSVFLSWLTIIILFFLVNSTIMLIFAFSLPKNSFADIVFASVSDLISLFFAAMFTRLFLVYFAGDDDTESDKNRLTDYSA
jgi:hypothetical protein